MYIYLSDFNKIFIISYLKDISIITKILYNINNMINLKLIYKDII